LIDCALAYSALLLGITVSFVEAPYKTHQSNNSLQPV